MAKVSRRRRTHPCDTVVVDVVEHRQARLWGLVDVEFSVVGLCDLLVSSLRPWIVSPADWVAVGWLNLLAVGGPEPSVEVLRQQVFSSLTTCLTSKVEQLSGASRAGRTHRWNHTSVPRSRCMARPSPGSAWRSDCSPLESRSKRRPCSTRGKCYGPPTSRRA